MTPERRKEIEEELETDEAANKLAVTKMNLPIMCRELLAALDSTTAELETCRETRDQQNVQIKSLQKELAYFKNLAEFHEKDSLGAHQRQIVCQQRTEAAESELAQLKARVDGCLCLPRCPAINDDAFYMVRSRDNSGWTMMVGWLVGKGAFDEWYGPLPEGEGDE